MVTIKSAVADQNVPSLISAIAVTVWVSARRKRVEILALPARGPRWTAITLGVVTFVQIFLGLTVVSMGSAKANAGVAAEVAAAHVATGAVTLAATLVVALEIWRCVRPAVQVPMAAKDQELSS